MDEKLRKRMKPAFFYEKEDGTISDIGLHNDLLQHEDEITQSLVNLGIVRRITVVNKITEKP